MSSSDSCCSRLGSCYKPHGFIAAVITKGLLGVLLFGVVWAIVGPLCVPGQNLFGLVVLFLSAVCGGKLVGMIQLPTLPPLPPLLGMLLMGLVLRNVPYVSEAVYIDQKWSSALRSVALAIILTRAGLGLNPAALRRLKAVCVRVAVGPCTTEACTVAVISHFLMGLPWIWGFILGFVLAAVSPAVVVPSMLLLQQSGYGVQKGIPTLLMAAGSFDDILAITGFTTCLGMYYVNHFNVMFDESYFSGWLILFCVQEDLVLRRSSLLLGLSVFSVFASHTAGLGGAGGLCTLVLSFIAGLSWDTKKAPVAAVVGRFWDVFQPMLFGLIGAEITISTLSPNTVGLGLAALCVGVVIRVLVTFAAVLFAGFNLKEKIFISLAWLPKATVQAAIGSTALDMARSVGDEQMEDYGMIVLTVAVLSILVTAPIGAIAIGLAGPRLLQKYTEINDTHTEACKGEAMIWFCCS
uniref:Cation/H+ exchanger transmembrane domain-containing protein n=1 Tax=Astyanax mexicanus TaxID=7994 RepID=A0A8B9HK34_ASTMX